MKWNELLYEWKDERNKRGGGEEGWDEMRWDVMWNKMWDEMRHEIKEKITEKKTRGTVEETTGCIQNDNPHNKIWWGNQKPLR